MNKNINDKHGDKMKKFKEFKLSANILETVTKKGFEEATPIQEKALPILLEKDIDLVGQAQTGTGKTAAFGIPIIERIHASRGYIQTIVLVPTRELALQVAEELNSLKGKKLIFITAIYGGQSIEQQIKKIKRGVDIVVGTPGRVLDLIKRKVLKLGNVSYCVLDEADEMLNMGFLEDVEEIIKHTNDNKRMLLFSATMPKRIADLAKRYMKEYETIHVAKGQLTVNLTDQIYFEVSASDKFDALCRIIDIEDEFYGIVFCRTKLNVSKVARHLIDRGYEADALHGDISQIQREKILARFKKQYINILVATDVAARGIDITELTHVINYSLPQDPESYIHRIGRTGRAGKEGTAITFVTPDEYRRLMLIQRIAKTEIRKEKLPNVKDIIQSKINKIKTGIEEIITSEEYNDCIDLANDLLKSYDAEKIIAAMIKSNYQDELDASSYTPLQDVSINKKGKTRLFIALGKNDDMTPNKIKKLITDKTNINEKLIRNVSVFDKFSFVNVPFKEAEVILDVFRRDRKGKRSIIEKAKEKKK